MAGGLSSLPAGQLQGLCNTCPQLAPPARLLAGARQRRAHLSIEARAHAVSMGVWATKAGMTQIFTPEGLCLPATVLALEDGNIVTQVLLVRLTFKGGRHQKYAFPKQYTVLSGCLYTWQKWGIPV